MDIIFLGYNTYVAIVSKINLIFETNLQENSTDYFLCNIAYILFLIFLVVLLSETTKLIIKIFRR